MARKSSRREEGKKVLFQFNKASCHRFFADNKLIHVAEKKESKRKRTRARKIRKAKHLAENPVRPGKREFFSFQTFHLFRRNHAPSIIGGNYQACCFLSHWDSFQKRNEK